MGKRLITLSIVAALIGLPMVLIIYASAVFNIASASSCDSVTDVPANIQLTGEQIATIKGHWDEVKEAAASAQPPLPPEVLVGVWYRENSIGTSSDVQAGNPFGGPYSRYSSSYANYGHPGNLEESLAIAAQVIQDEAKSGQFHRPINADNPDASVIKDALFGYNGRAQVYADQAAKLGFNAKTEPFEGSPYVMNDFDDRHRDMLKISVDFGGIDTVDKQLGAYTVFSQLRLQNGGSIVDAISCNDAGGNTPTITNGWSLPITSGSYTLGVPFGQHGPEWSLGYHTGQDFPASEGTPIHAVADGVISFASWTDSYGNETDETINDGGRVVHVVYAHAVRRAPGITAGTRVSAGQVIAYVGETGNAFGYHLHFEYRPAQNNYQDAQDPVPWLRSHGLNP